MQVGLIFATLDVSGTYLSAVNCRYGMRIYDLRKLQAQGKVKNKCMYSSFHWKPLNRTF
jgi:hypothetical protein